MGNLWPGYMSTHTDNSFNIPTVLVTIKVTNFFFFGGGGGGMIDKIPLEEYSPTASISHQ